jgi:hypothetical protein
MKNVTKILTAVTFCAALFASDQRIDALGGNAAFWPGDEANIAAFPAQVNNHSYLQLSGVGGDGAETETFDANGHVSILWQEDGTTWGFNYGGDDWVNMHWGNGDMGVTVGMEKDGADNTSGEKSDMSVSWGGDLGIGEMGIHYATTNNGDGDATLGVDWRKDCGFWIFDNTVVHAPDLMADDLAVHADFWKAIDAGGASVVYAFGVEYAGGDAGYMSHSATVGVEANMTDWATLRAGYTWGHKLSDEGDQVGNTGDAFTWGLGFNWGGLTADLTVDSGLFQDPVGAITGYDDGGVTDHTVTLTYGF